MFVVNIPMATKEEILRRYKLLKPIREFAGVKYWLPALSDKELARNLFDIPQSECVKVTNGLVYAKKFMCLHRKLSNGIFTPTLCDILAQVSDMDATHYCAFEIVNVMTNYLQLCNGSIESMILRQGKFDISTIRMYVMEKQKSKPSKYR